MALFAFFGPALCARRAELGCTYTARTRRKRKAQPYPSTNAETMASIMVKNTHTAVVSILYAAEKVNMFLLNIIPASENSSATVSATVKKYIRYPPICRRTLRKANLKSNASPFCGCIE